MSAYARDNIYASRRRARDRYITDIYAYTPNTAVEDRH